MASCSESNAVLDAINEAFDEFEKNLADSSSSYDSSDSSDCDFYDSDPDVMRQMRGELFSDSDDSDSDESDDDQVVIKSKDLSSFATEDHRRIYDMITAVDNELTLAIRKEVTELLYPVIVPLLGIKIMRALSLVYEMLTPDLTQIFDTMTDSDLIVSLIKTLFIYAKNHSPDFLEGLNFALGQLNPITN